MTKQVINVGSAANDGTGDTLRAASQKINSNFTEVYVAAQAAFDKANTSNTISVEQRYFDYVEDVSLYGTTDLTAVTNLRVDDNEYQINLPFSVTFLGQTYNTVWLNSNSYLTFQSIVNNSPGGYAHYWPISPETMNVPTISVGAADRAITNYYYGSTGDGRFVIRYEGSVPNWVNNGSATSTRIWEIWFHESEPGKISLVVKSNMEQTGGVWGIHDGSKWIDIYEELPRMNQKRDGWNYINSVDIYTKSSNTANTFKFLGAGVETYTTNDETFVTINPLQGLIDLTMDGDGDTHITAAGYGLVLNSNHDQHLKLHSQNEIIIEARTWPEENPRTGSSVSIYGGSGTNNSNQNGGNVNLIAGHGTGTGVGGSIYLTTNDGSNHTWSFNSNGSIQFPDGLLQTRAYNNTANNIVGDTNPSRTILDVTKGVQVMTTNGGTQPDFELPDGLYDGQEMTFVQHDGQNVNIYIHNFRLPNNQTLQQNLAWYPFQSQTAVAKAVWAIDAWHLSNNYWD